jgi:hypothetical protein
MDSICRKRRKRPIDFSLWPLAFAMPARAFGDGAGAMIPAWVKMASRDTTTEGDLVGDITRHFDGMAVTASLNPCQSLAAGGFCRPKAFWTGLTGFTGF